MANNSLNLSLLVTANTTQANQNLTNFNGNVNSLNNHGLAVSNTFSKFAGVLAGVGFAAIANEIIQTNIKFEALRASLDSAVGGAENAQIAFDQIQKFASATPYSVEEVTQSFIKLKNLGLTPSEEALTSYGNTAGAMGKSLNDMIEAVADAATGEFERLKEFGIKSSKEGENVTFTFKGIKTTVKNTSEEIQAYLLKLGQTDFAGGMDKQAETMKGQLSSMGDAWDAFYDHIISKTGENTLANVIGFATEEIKNLDLWLNGAQSTAEKIDAINEKIASSQAKINAHNNNNFFTAFIDDLAGFDVNQELNKQDSLRKELTKTTAQLDKETAAFKDMTAAAKADADTPIDTKKLAQINEEVAGLRGKLFAEKEVNAAKFVGIEYSKQMAAVIDAENTIRKLGIDLTSSYANEISAATIAAGNYKNVSAKVLELADEENKSYESRIANLKRLYDAGILSTEDYQSQTSQLTAEHNSRIENLERNHQDIMRAIEDNSSALASINQQYQDKEITLTQYNNQLESLMRAHQDRLQQLQRQSNSLEINKLDQHLNELLNKERDAYLKSREDLKIILDQKLITQEGYDSSLQQLETQHASALTQIRTNANASYAESLVGMDTAASSVSNKIAKAMSDSAGSVAVSFQQMGAKTTQDVNYFYISQLASLENLHKSGVISEQEYNDQRTELTRVHNVRLEELENIHQQTMAEIKRNSESLDTLSEKFKSGEITQEQYNLQKEQLEQAHQAVLAELKAKAAALEVTGLQEHQQTLLDQENAAYLKEREALAIALQNNLITKEENQSSLEQLEKDHLAALKTIRDNATASYVESLAGMDKTATSVSNSIASAMSQSANSVANSFAGMANSVQNSLSGIIAAQGFSGNQTININSQSQPNYNNNDGDYVTELPTFHTGGIVGEENVTLLRGEGVFTNGQMRQLMPASALSDVLNNSEIMLNGADFMPEYVRVNTSFIQQLDKIGIVLSEAASKIATSFDKGFSSNTGSSGSNSTTFANQSTTANTPAAPDFSQLSKEEIYQLSLDYLGLSADTRTNIYSNNANGQLVANGMIGNLSTLPKKVAGNQVFDSYTPAFGSGNTGFDRLAGYFVDQQKLAEFYNQKQPENSTQIANDLQTTQQNFGMGLQDYAKNSIQFTQDYSKAGVAFNDDYKKITTEAITKNTENLTVNKTQNSDFLRQYSELNDAQINNFIALNSDFLTQFADLLSNTKPTITTDNTANSLISAARASSTQPKVIVNVQEAQNTKTEIKQSTAPDGTLQIDVIARAVESQMIDNVKQGRGLAGVLRSDYNLHRRPG